MKSRDQIQDEAVKAWEETGGRGTIVAGVGVGKTLTAIKAAKKYPFEKILLVSPTEVIIDNWKEECEKWEFEWEKIDPICYASLLKRDVSQYDLVILDECFPGYTRIKTKQGTKRIEEIVSDFKKGKETFVLSFNEGKALFEYKPVTNVFNRGIKSTLKFGVGNRSFFECTPNHRLLTIDGKYVPAKKLLPGDILISHPEYRYGVKVYSNDFQNFAVGSKLGDGCLTKINNKDSFHRIKFTHGEKQKEYISWKASLFSRKIRRIEKNGYAEKPAYTFSTLGFYFPDKTIEEFIDLVNWKSLAIMIMDDGCLNKKSPHYSLFSVTNYGLSANKYLSNYLFNKYGIESSLVQDKRKNNCFSLSFDKKSSKKISKEIAPYVCQSMSHKVLRENRQLVGSYVWKIREEPYTALHINSKKESENQMVYDIEVRDNHNFTVSSGPKNKRKKYPSKPLFVAHNCHSITPAKKGAFDRIKEVPFIIGLTGTPPIDSEKKRFLKEYCPICFQFSLDDAVEEEYVADYQVILCPVALDNKEKYIKSGSKKNGYFYVTEERQHEYLNTKLSRAKYAGDSQLIKLAAMERLRFFGSLKSKIGVVKKISDMFIHEKHLIFTSNIAVAEQVCEHSFHSKQKTKETLEKFQNDEISRLAVVNALNEGVSVPGIQSGIFSNYIKAYRQVIQRIGRILRRKDGLPANIFFVYAQNTREEEIVKELLKSLNASKVFYI